MTSGKEAEYCRLWQFKISNLDSDPCIHHQNGVYSNMLIFTYIHSPHEKLLTQETYTDHLLHTKCGVPEELFKRDAMVPNPHI